MEAFDIKNPVCEHLPKVSSLDITHGGAVDAWARGLCVDCYTKEVEADTEHRQIKGVLKTEKINLNGNTFEIVDSVPPNFFIWNIGKNMPDGYLPLCRLADVQPFEGGRSIDVNTLKAIKTPNAQKILEVACVGATVAEIKKFIKKNENKKPSWARTYAEKAKKALPLMQNIKGL